MLTVFHILEKTARLDYALRGNLHGAIEQLELAKQAGESFYQMSVIKSDLRELMEMAGAHGKP